MTYNIDKKVTLNHLDICGIFTKFLLFLLETSLRRCTSPKPEFEDVSMEDCRPEVTRAASWRGGNKHIWARWFQPICAMVKSRYIGDDHDPTFNRESL